MHSVSVEAAVWPRCAADVRGLTTPAPVVRAGEVRAGEVRARPLCVSPLACRAGRGGSASDGGAEQHRQEEQVLEGLSSAVAVAHRSVRGSPVYHPSCLAVTWCLWFSALSGSTVLLVTETMLLSRPTSLPNWSLLAGSPRFGDPCVVWLAAPNLKGPGSPQSPSDPAVV